MDLATMVRIGAGILSVIFVVIIVVRRKKMSTRRKHVI
jgi:hypothetical protein